MAIFIGAGFWLLAGSAFGLISSIKFHQPQFLADCAWLTYGRVRPAFINALVYGAFLPSALGLAVWVFARLGRTDAVNPGLIAFGAVVWNAGVLVGLGGILAGDSTGFDYLEMPGYATWILFLGYLMLAVWAAATFHLRREDKVFEAQWHLLAALFWFAWIYTTAQLLLVFFPVRGMAQAAIAWWFANNLLVVWMGLAGTAFLYYFLPALTGRELHSRYLALFAFWILILFGSWGGIPNSAPVPAWMPVLSTVGTVMLVIPLIAFYLNFSRTVSLNFLAGGSESALAFLRFGALALVLAGMLRVLDALVPVHKVVGMTWYVLGRDLFWVYGFFGMVLFGGIYAILPRLMGMPLPSPGWVRLHFWLAASGILLATVPLLAAGVYQGLKLANPSIAFVDVSRGTLHFLRLGTIGDVLLALGHLLFLGNCVRLVVAALRSRVSDSYRQATADLFSSAEVKS
jgi:cytochrome c oxidase cbb3-type subunit 1